MMMAAAQLKVVPSRNWAWHIASGDAMEGTGWNLKGEAAANFTKFACSFDSRVRKMRVILVGGWGFANSSVLSLGSLDNVD